MSSSWRRLITAAVVLSLGSLVLWAGLRAASSPSVLAGLLEDLLGRPVEVSGLKIGFGDELEFEFRELAVFEPAARAEHPGDPGPPVLQVARAHGSLSWRRLLDGGWIPLKWRLEAPVWILRGAEAGPWIELPPLPLEVAAEDGVLEWHAEGAAPLRFEDLDLRVRSSGPDRTLHGTARGNLAQEGSRASFSLEFEGSPEAWSATGEVAGLQLAGLAAYAGSDTTPGGSASGRFTVAYEAGVWEGWINLGIERFRLQLPNFSGPIAPQEARVVLEARVEAGSARIRAERVELDDFILSGELELSPGPGRRIRGVLQVADFQPGQPGERLQFLRLVGLRHGSWRDFDARTEGGRIQDLRLELNLELDRLGAALAYDMKPDPSELRLSGRVRDGIYRPSPGASPLEKISGEIELIGNRLEIRDLAIWRDGKPLPRIELHVEGMHRLTHLPKQARKTPRGPGVPIPGLGSAFRAMQGKPGTDAPPVVVQLRHFDLGVPAFVLELRDASGILDFPNGNLRLVSAEGTLGGAPARISALWDRAQNRVSTEIVYEDGPALPHRRPRPDPAAPYPWAEGEFRIQSAHFGGWRIDGLQAALRATGADVALSEIVGTLATGPVEARGKLSLAEPDSAPFSLQFNARGADVEALLGFLSLPPDALSGTAAAQGSLSGSLMPGRPFLAGADADFSVGVESGSVENLPAWVLLARLATPLGWRGLIGRPLPFDEIRSRVRIDRGILELERFELQGPELRAIAVGNLDLISTERETDMVIAMLFLETVDRVLRRVPIIGPWVLGDDQNLVALYFQLKGPWEAPQGRYLPPDALQNAVGLAGRVVGVVKRLRDLLLSPLPSLPLRLSEEAHASERTQ
ncbi:MAG: hypothetical protein HRU00_06295 [Myxococcales bacterium]|nr:hypothetical protein [Myxococcales bacterium]